VIRKRVIAHGRVQGVFFRDSVRRRAESFGVAGWVRNRDDGTAEAVFEGDEGAVDAMVEFIQEGPGRADVTRVEVNDEQPGSESGFQVR
jgi:acylphosphatase